MKVIGMKISFHQGAFWALCVLWAALTFSTALVEISFVVALVCWLLWKVRSRLWMTNQVPLSLFLPLLGFVLLVVGSYFWSENPEASFRGVFKILQQVAIFWLVLDVFHTRENVRRFEKVFLIVSLVLVLNGFFQYAFGKDFLRGFAGEASRAGMRIKASFSSYGLLASFLISTVPFLVALGFVAKSREKGRLEAVLCGVIVLGSLVLLLLTRSRGAFLAFVFGTVVFLLVKRRLWLIVLLLAVIVGALFIVPRSMIFHFSLKFHEQSLAERYYLWDRAIHVIKEKPWGGTGINTYASTHLKYDKTKNWRVRGYYVHNGYLQLAVETGLPCLFLFLWFLGRYLWLSFHHARSDLLLYEKNLLLGLIIGIINFLFFVAVDTVLHNPQPAMVFWYLLGLQWAYQKVSCSE